MHGVDFPTSENGSLDLCRFWIRHESTYTNDVEGVVIGP